MFLENDIISDIMVSKFQILKKKLSLCLSCTTVYLKQISCPKYTPIRIYTGARVPPPEFDHTKKACIVQ